MDLKDFENLRGSQLSLSKSHKFMYYLLTSPELGYKQVEVERPYNGGHADLYIHDIDVAIELDGPNHYFNQLDKRLMTV